MQHCVLPDYYSKWKVFSASLNSWGYVRQDVHVRLENHYGYYCVYIPIFLFVFAL